MPAPQYALVAYVKNELGRFVEGLRHEIHPALDHLPAHLTILRELCRAVAPFEVALDSVESFEPVTPTVYLRVEGAEPMHALHERLNTAEFACREQWTYVPHLTIVKLVDDSRLSAVRELARRRWSAYRGPRRTRVEELTFVREGGRADQWTDLAPVPLGGALAPGS
jgi:2'-5' RNA ligase